MTYDIIIIGWWAAGLFCAIHAPKRASKLILEKNQTCGTKVLLSGWERANVSNAAIELEKDYFGHNTKVLHSIFHHFNTQSLRDFFSRHSIELVEEDRNRLILKSGNSREVLEFLVRETEKNQTKILCNSWVKKIINPNDVFEITTEDGKKYLAKNIVITTWGKSFSQVGTTWDGYEFACDFWHSVIPPYRGLCGLVTRQDFQEISWVSCQLEMKVVSSFAKKPIYQETWPLLFTHFWVSGPIIFNAVLAIGQHFSKQKFEYDVSNLPVSEQPDGIQKAFLQEHIHIKLVFHLENTPKRLIQFFVLSEENREVEIVFQDFRSWKEAKVTGWGVKIDELDSTLQSKKVSGLFFAGEILDITWKTGWYNLQFAWSSAYTVAIWLKEIL